MTRNMAFNKSKSVFLNAPATRCAINLNYCKHSILLELWAYIYSHNSLIRPWKYYANVDIMLIPIPVSEMPQIQPKMLDQALTGTQVYALVWYYNIFQASSSTPVPLKNVFQAEAANIDSSRATCVTLNMSANVNLLIPVFWMHLFMFYKATSSVQREHNDVKSHHIVSKEPPNYLPNDTLRRVSLT